MNRHWLPLLTFALLLGCNSSALTTDSSNDEAATSETFGGPSEPRKLDSAQAVSAILQKRWTMDYIHEFCVPERRHNPAYQGLVTEGARWEGKIHEDNTDFDSISWYGNMSDGQLISYSLSAQKGDSYWLLEIGNAKSLATPPETAPDPAQPHFSGTGNN